MEILFRGIKILARRDSQENITLLVIRLILFESRKLLFFFSMLVVVMRGLVVNIHTNLKAMSWIKKGNVGSFISRDAPPPCTFVCMPLLFFRYLFLFISWTPWEVSYSTCLFWFDIKRAGHIDLNTPIHHGNIFPPPHTILLCSYTPCTEWQIRSANEIYSPTIYFRILKC